MKPADEPARLTGWSRTALAAWVSSVSPPWRVLADLRRYWLLWVLLALDAALMVLHVAYHLSWRGGQWSAFHHEFLSLDRDHGLAELCQYAKTAVAAGLLAHFSVRFGQPVYGVCSAVLAFVLLDDSLELHEQSGRYLAAALDLPAHIGPLRSVDLMEPALWFVAGAILLVLLILAARRSSPHHVGVCVLLLPPFVALAVCGGLGDILHAGGHRIVAGSALALTLLEDGGELLSISVICALVVWIGRRPAVAPRHAAPA
jgi:hypothetical protein